MVKFSSGTLDRTFAALADPHCRLILDRIGGGSVSVSSLAAPLGMSLPGVLKHVRLLEEAQLIRTQKEGRTRWCWLDPRPLDEATAWIADRRAHAEGRLDRFARHIEETKETE